MASIKCRVCGGPLEMQADGRAQCLTCGLFYSTAALVELWQADEQTEEPCTAEAEEDAASGPEDEIAVLQSEQLRLLAEIRMSDGAYGPAQRRRLSSELRKVEKRLAKLEGRKLPFWF